MIFDFLPIIFEALAVLLAITYLLLAVRQDIRCWFAGILSSLIYLYLMFSVNLYMESVLQIFYVGMGFYGWFKWNKSQQMSNNSNIVTWRPAKHLVVVFFIVLTAFKPISLINALFDDNLSKEFINSKEVDEAIDNLKKNNLVFKGKIEAPEGEDKSKWVEREQLLFKSTNYGDDKDRALTKSDNSWTYFAGDIAYHNNKLKRNFDEYINILGADHAGYIKRINSVVDALSNKKKNLICKVTQLVKLIKDGKPFKMSKRKGDYIIVDDLVNEVGKDATRFIMLSRSNDVQLEFDFEKVKEKSKDNPLYYVQYCYARICSVFKNANEKIENDLTEVEKNYEFNDEEIKTVSYTHLTLPTKA